MVDFKNHYAFLQEGTNRQEVANKGIPDRVPIIIDKNDLPHLLWQPIFEGPVTC